MEKKKIKLFISIVLIIIILLLVMYQFGLFSGKKINPGRTALDNKYNAGDICTVKKIEVPNFYTTIGSIHSRNETEISSRLTAKITALKARSGDKVKEGDVSCCFTK